MERNQQAAGSGQQADGGNRAALLTAPGASAIAVVRIAGRLVGDFLSRHFSSQARPGRCVHGVLRDAQRIIDDPVIVLSDDQRCADISLHGGEWVVRECLELAQRAGFQIVQSADDLLDADTEIEREMLAALPAARTEQALRMLLAQPQAWARLQQRENLAAGEVRRILHDRTLWWMLHPPRIAIVGAANVGKSTLANQLFGQARSITADVPGTTRDWVGDWANLAGLPVHLLDTPGQRKSDDPIEQAAIERARREIESAELVVLVLDAVRPLDPEQTEIHRRYPRSLIVVNKCDLPHAWDVAGVAGAVRTIATSGEGIAALQSRVLELLGCSLSPLDAPRWWTSRQYAVLCRMVSEEQS